MEFSKEAYWGGLFPSSGDLPNPGMEHRSPALQADSLLSEPLISVQSLSRVLTLCDPMDCSTPGFPVHHHLLELTQAHIH